MLLAAHLFKCWWNVLNFVFELFRMIYVWQNSIYFEFIVNFACKFILVINLISNSFLVSEHSTNFWVHPFRLFWVFVKQNQNENIKNMRTENEITQFNWKEMKKLSAWYSERHVHVEMSTCHYTDCYHFERTKKQKDQRQNQHAFYS